METSERRIRSYRKIFSSSLLFTSLFLSRNLPLASTFESIPTTNSIRTRSAHSENSLATVPFLSSKTCLNQQTTKLSDVSEVTYIIDLPHRQRQRLRKWDRMIADLTAFRAIKGHSLVSAEDVEEDKRWAELYLWTRSVRRNYVHQVMESRPKRTAATDLENLRRRHTLPREKLLALQKLDFCWDVQGINWEKRYKQLLEFHREHGHSKVPANYPNGLGVFVRNCRREYRRLEQGEPSTLTVDRLNKLFAVDFVWSRSREEAWEYRYQQLQEFYQRHGHSNVPEHYPENPALGLWCMNQRTYYSRLYRREMSSLTEERMQLLEDVGFVWNYRQYWFDYMLNRLSNYHRENGHVQISTIDPQNQDLRLWITIQRYYYHRRQRDLAKGKEPSVPLTQERIEAIESAIPEFNWRGRGINNGGPSSQDWAKLFDEMRKQGIQPGMRAKQHWFDGVNPFSVNVKETWTEEELLALWNAESDEDDNDTSYDSSM